MIVNDLMTKIQTNLSEFSKGQRLIARYITEHYDKAAFMTASRLGSTVGVSESTVVRFATELGYDGYPHLQKALQEMIRNRLTAVQRMEVAGDRMGNRDVLESVLSSDVEKIRMTLDELDREAFHSTAGAIVRARRIYILGVRSSSALANFMGFYFTLLFENVRVLYTNSVSEIFEQILRIGPEDVFIGISFPRYSHEILQRPRRQGHCADRLPPVSSRPLRRPHADCKERYGEFRGLARRSAVRDQRADCPGQHGPSGRSRANLQQTGNHLGRVSRI